MLQRHYLLDTNILACLAELKARDPKALKSHLKRLPDGTKICLCPVTIGEVESGVRVDYANSDKSQLAKELLLAFACLNIDGNLARDYYADLRARLFRRYAPKDSDNRKTRRMREWKDPTTSEELQIDENDLWIASVAMAYNLILVTRDNMKAIRTVAGADVIFEDWLDWLK